MASAANSAKSMEKKPSSMYTRPSTHASSFSSCRACSHRPAVSTSTSIFSNASIACSVIS